MRKALFLAGGFFSLTLLVFVPAGPVSANSLSIAPLTYQTALQANEDKKGYVDILNPEPSSSVVTLKVQAFRQINNEGGLQFYDDEAIARGVKLDLTSITLGPGEGARIYFILDASELPSGDVFGAILASTGAASEAAVSVPSAQVGTLLMLTNGTPPKHHAEVRAFSASWLQTGRAITAQIGVSNTDPEGGQAIAFMPEIQFGVNPYHNQTVTGPLIFSGRSRTIEYVQTGDYFGPVLLKAAIGDSTQTKLVFAITGYWQWLAPLIIFVLLAIIPPIIYQARTRRDKAVKKQRS